MIFHNRKHTSKSVDKAVFGTSLPAPSVLPTTHLAGSQVTGPATRYPNMPYPGFTLLSFRGNGLSSHVHYFQQEATGALCHWVKWFWMVESDSSEPVTQKIIPDGYPEVIFHYADPYEIDISGKWESQSPNLLAGQATRYFHLQNTGLARMFAIKLQPWSLRTVLGVDAANLQNRVIPLPLTGIWEDLRAIGLDYQTFEDKCLAASDLIMEQRWQPLALVQEAVQHILKVNGLLTIQELTKAVGTSERTLERHFRLHVGLSPKKYCRIIRHAYVFKVVNEKPDNWAQVAYKAGYYDQTHFIKNFQEFTGEDPSKYGFNDQTFANFFLK